MNESQARAELEEILATASPGEQATVQSEGQIDHPHGEDTHTDAWLGTKEQDGSVSVEKIHG
jgi:hypothetical protein